MLIWTFGKGKVEASGAVGKPRLAKKYIVVHSSIIVVKKKKEIYINVVLSLHKMKSCKREIELKR